MRDARARPRSTANPSAASCLAAAPLGPRFTPLHLLGAGGMGVVVAAFDHELDRTVAVKTLHRARASDALARRRLQREGEIHAGLGVAGVVPLLDRCETTTGAPCLVLELVAGQTLRRAAGPVREMLSDRQHAARVLDWLADVSETIERMHARGLLHLDIKPDNVIVDEVQRAWVIDMGSARAPTTLEATERGSLPGTPPYAPIEVFRGPAIDERTDLFSLAITALEVLTGELPWEVAAETESALVRSALLEPAPRLSRRRPELEAALDEALARAADRDPARRRTSLRELRALFRGAARRLRARCSVRDQRTAV